MVLVSWPKGKWRVTVQLLSDDARDLKSAEAGRVIDASGQIVAPGFIDVHTHADGWLLKTPHLDSKTRQGFTTEILMVDGISYAPVNDATARQWMYYLRALDGLLTSGRGQRLGIFAGTGVGKSVLMGMICRHTIIAKKGTIPTTVPAMAMRSFCFSAIVVDR